MSKVLVCWELGGGYGHIYPLLRFAKRMREQGHEVVFAVRNIESAGFLIMAEGFKWVSAPSIRVPTRNYDPKTHADILIANGFNNASNLVTLVKTWQNLIDILGIEYVLADSCPAVMIAAQCSNVRAMRVGTGYFDPNPDDALPFLKPIDSLEEALKSTSVCIDVINEAFKFLGLPVILELQDLFRSDIIYTNWAETNPFGKHHPDLHIGAQAISLHAREPLWRTIPGKKAFVYLKNDFPDTVRMILFLVSKGYNLSVCLGKNPPDVVKDLHSKHRLYMNPHEVDFEHMDDEVELVAAHGGNTMNFALAQGKRVIALPLHNEHILNATQNMENGLPVAVYRFGVTSIENTLEAVYAVPTVKLPCPADGVDRLINALFHEGTL